MKKLICVLALVAMASFAAAESSFVQYADHNVTFVDVNQTDGMCTWYYYVCSGESPALSHWIIQSCVGTTNEYIEWGTDPYLEGEITYGIDPTTGITGLKFDVGMDDGQCAMFWFTVKECYGDDKELGIKAGQDTYTGSYIFGPRHDDTTTTTTSTTTTSTTYSTTTTTVPNAPEFASMAVAAAILLSAPAFAYLMVKKE